MKIRRRQIPAAICLGAAPVLGAAVLALPGGTPAMAVATLAYGLLSTGILFRKNRKFHAGCMATGVGLDLLLVATLQVLRNAVQTAVAFTLEPLQQLHVATSATATLLYFFVIPLGILSYRRLGNARSPRLARWHRTLGWTAFVFRTLGFFFMFSLLGHAAGGKI